NDGIRDLIVTGVQTCALPIYLEGRGESYGGGIPYLPVIELLKEYFHIDVRDDPPAMAEKVTAQLLVLDPALAPDLSALLALLNRSEERRVGEEADGSVASLRQ